MKRHTASTTQDRQLQQLQGQPAAAGVGSRFLFLQAASEAAEPAGVPQCKTSSSKLQAAVKDAVQLLPASGCH